MEKKTYQDLMRIYNEMYQVDEARRNAGSGGGGKGAKYVQNVSDTPVGYVQDREKRGGEAVDKKKSQSSYKDHLDTEKASKYGMTPEERRERARRNKEKKAKAGIDNILKVIRRK
jgi:hypothetical protein